MLPRIGKKKSKTSSLATTLDITVLSIDQLKPNPGNPRIHTKKQVRQIGESILEFGFVNPLLVDADLRVIAGHGRLLAARQLGLSDVPIIPLKHLTPAQAKALALADNKLTENASWDDRLLGEQLRELSELDLDFSLDVTGFEIGEIDLLIEGATTQPDSDDEVLGPQQGPAVCQPGDLWRLGPHRIYCGNALEESAYQALLGEDQADVIITDAPYNVPIQGHASGLGAIHHREFAMACGEMDKAEFTQFLAQACRLLARYSRDGSLHFLTMDWRHVGELLDAAQPVYSEWLNLCVWVKSTPGMGGLYRSGHELVFVFKNGRGRHRNNVQLGKHGRNRTNVWSYPDARSFSRSSEEGNLLALHPTVKPVRLVADAILDCTAPGDIVLDAFLGSGTTLIAAERVRRVCRGLEIDPLYVDTGIRRWQAYTGESAYHATTGRSFDEISHTLGDNND